MNKEFDSSEKIEAYLKNELSPVEKAEFEERISRDPLLQNELTLQQEIITSLQDFRIAELKARLNQIDVNEVPAAGANWFFYFKTAGILAIVAAVLGYGGVRLLNQQKSAIPVRAEKNTDQKALGTLPPSTKLNTTDSQPSANAQSMPTPTKEASSNKNSTEEKVKSSHPVLKSSSEPEEQNVTEPTGSKAIRPENQREEEQNESSVTKGSVSNLAAKQSEKAENPTKKGAERPSGTNEKISSGNSKGTSGLNITFSESRYKFHYTNINNNLSLYGDFTKGYQKIKLNGQEYLYFDNNFYLLKANQRKISPLLKVTNEALLNKLRQITEQQ